MPAVFSTPSQRCVSASRYLAKERSQDNWSYPIVALIKTGATDAPLTISPSLSASPVDGSPRFAYLQSDNDIVSPAFFTQHLPSASPSQPGTKNHARRGEPGYVPRPRNAFIVFRSHYIQESRASGEVQQNELSKAAGHAWRSMTDEEQRVFKEIADQEQAEHKIAHPNYQYAPGPRRPTPYPKPVKAKAVPRKRTAASPWSSSSSSSSAQLKLFRATRATHWDSDAPSPSPSSSDSSSDAYSPELVPHRCAQAAVERLEQLALDSHILMPSALSPEVAHYTSDEATSPVSSTPDFSGIGFVPTEEIPVLSLDGSVQQENENEKEEITEFTLDGPSTLGFFGFDPFDMYTSYPEFGCIPDTVFVPRPACGADTYAEPAMGVSYAGDGQVGYQQSEADLEQLFLAQMEYGIGNYELFGIDDDDTPILS